MKNFMLMAAFFAVFSAFSQFSDSFNDGNFTDDPAWSGDTGKFVVSENARLQLNAPNETATAQLFTPSVRALNTLWEFEVGMNTTPTTGNYVKVYLCGDTIGSGKLWGLCLRIGYSKDVCLWYEPQTGSGKSLLKGLANRLDLNTVSLKVRAELNQNGLFRLQTQLPGETDFFLEGEVTLTSATIPESSYFGVTCIYSSTKSKGVYSFDDFRVVPLTDTPDPEEDPEEAYPDSLAVIINEVLYQPFTDADEYLELYNRSDKAVDISLLSLATRKTDGSLQRIKPLAEVETYLLPGEYLLVTGLKERVCNFYACRSDIKYVEFGTMISLADAGGTIVLFNNRNQQVIDEFTYTNKMHVTGLSNPKGVALERIYSEVATNDVSNWTSATADAGYGTPGYQNSRSSKDEDEDPETGIRVLEPNPLNGIDYFQINYSFVHSDNRCNLMIFDVSGRLIDTVLNNGVLGNTGTIQWNPKKNLRPGVYIVYAEVFQLSGGVEKYKLPVIVR